MIKEYGLNEVHILNTNSANWKRTDYLSGYIDMGLRPYIQFKEFMERYPILTIAPALHVIGLSKTGRSQVNKKGIKYFETGNLVIPDIQYSNSIADKIVDFSKFYKNASRITFVSAVCIIVQHKNYNHEEMMARLSRRPEQLIDQTNGNNYVLLLEDIFNYNRRQKVSLRY